MQSAFLPRTTLTPNESRFNFTMMDNPALDLLTSAEAEKACSKMLLIYTRLRRAEWKYFERPGVLNIYGESAANGESEGKRTAWQILMKIAGVASATLDKALQWMKEHRVIGYWSGKNGVGIRIFFNVAAGSVRTREQKNLRLVPTSFGEARTSFAEAPFNDSFAVKSIQDSDIRAAARDDEPPAANEQRNLPLFAEPSEPPLPPAPPVTVPPTAPPRLHLVPRSPDLDELTARLAALEAGSAQVQKALREVVARVPDKNWLEKYGLPKMTRVLFNEFLKAQGSTAKADVGAKSSPPEELPAYLAAAEAEQQADANAAQALAVLPAATYQQWYAELEQHCKTDPRYKNWDQWLPDVRREHLETLMKARLKEQNEFRGK